MYEKQGANIKVLMTKEWKVLDSIKSLRGNNDYESPGQDAKLPAGSVLAQNQ